MTRVQQTVLVLGASGQTGSFLVKHASQAGDRVVAATRQMTEAQPNAWRVLGIADGVERRAIDYLDTRMVADLIGEVAPDSVHVLAGQSSVRRSFAEPAQTIASHIQPILNVLEAVRTIAPATKVVYASSVEVFGHPQGMADETARFDPQSPYAAGKVAGTTVVRSYRESFGLSCCSAFLSNHESALRNEDFLFGKLLSGLARIVAGESDSVATGPLGIRRDFGYAPEFATGLLSIADGACNTDLILASGQTVVLREAVRAMFKAFDLDPARYLSLIHI